MDVRSVTEREMMGFSQERVIAVTHRQTKALTLGQDGLKFRDRQDEGIIVLDSQRGLFGLFALLGCSAAVCG